MLRVLFVDDDPNVIAALQRMLRPQRDVWEMFFAHDPKEALALVDQHAPDVVISDLRMPETDGCQLLAEVAKRRPQAVRMILSGFVSQRALVESMGIAHQFLPQPLDPEMLKRAIERACELRRWIARPEVAQAIARVGKLPTLPATAQRITAAVQRDASLSEIGNIVAEDPALTARLLQVANSAYFAPRRPITSAALAASFLGLEMLKPLVLFGGVADSAKNNAVVQARLDRLWRHSLEVAHAARALAAHCGADRDAIASAFSMGILHDVGTLVTIAEHDVSDQGNAQFSADELEREQRGVSHTEIGAHVAISWGLPDDAVETVAWHHDATRFAVTPKPTANFFVAAACAMKDGEAGGAAETSLEMARFEQALAARGLADKLDEWRGLVRTPETVKA